VSKFFLGIDPGVAAGGISLLDEQGKLLEIHKIPTFTIETGRKTTNGNKKKQTQIDFRALFDILDPIYQKGEVHAYVEEITHLFGLPSSSNFKLGYACGVVHAALQTFGDFYLVSPKTWQSEIWVPGDIIYKMTKSSQKRTDPKPTSKRAAQRLYPDESFILPRGKAFHDGAAEATLIAEYGRRQHGTDTEN